MRSTSFLYQRKDKRADGTPRILCVSHSSFNKADFCGEGTDHFRLSGNRFKSRFGTNTKLLLGVIGPISTLNVHLNTVSLRGSCRNNALPRSPREKLQLVRCLILSMGVKSLSLQERNMLFIDRLNK